MNWVSIARVVACSGQQLLQLTWKHTVFVLACPTWTSASRAGELPQELDSCQWFCPLNLWVPSRTAFREIARWLAGAQTRTQTWTLLPDKLVVKVLEPMKSQHKLCEVWILFKSVADAKFEPSEVTFLRLTPSAGLSSEYPVSSCSVALRKSLLFYWTSTCHCLH